MSKPTDWREAPQLGTPSSMELTIGAVAAAAGVPANTLRTWERRYGYPEPKRTSGNQRLYDPSIVPRLRLIARAIDRGIRARQAVAASEAELRLMVDEELPALQDLSVYSGPQGAGSPYGGSSRPQVLAASSQGAQEAPALRLRAADDVIAGWLAAAKALDGAALDRGFGADSSRLGGLTFLMDRAAPFVHAVGEAWASGDLEIFQEHFASERLRSFLSSLWRPLADNACGPVVVCCTLPGEDHALGLHMAATAIAIAGWRVMFLGARTPVDEIVACAQQTGADTVLVSVSRSTSGRESEAQVRALRKALPDGVALVLGGAGSPDRVSGTERITNLADLHAWAQRRSSDAADRDSR